MQHRTAAMVISTTPFFFILLLSLTSLAFAADTPTIGINYGRLGNNLPNPSSVVTLLKSQSITHTKIYDTDSTVLTAFANSGISLTVNLPNELLSRASSSVTYTTSWLKSTILPYYPATNITTIAVGNEVLSSNTTTPYLIPSITNLHTSLKQLNLHTSIKLSSPIALSALASSYPPSSATFQPYLINPVIKPLLSFLHSTSSPLMINAYPFLAYIANSDTISLDYALFKPSATPIIDSGNGLHYTNLFDAQVDAVYAAMKKLNYNDIPIVVTETGWPSKGDDNEPGATPTNAAAFNGNLVKKVLTRTGTPLKPNQPLTVYLFALFNENQKPGPTSERNFGLFYPDTKRVYDIPLTLAQLGTTPTATNGSKVTVASPAAAPTTGDEDSQAPEPTVDVAESPEPTAVGPAHTWCVASGSATTEKLQAALDYACGEGKADCAPIQNGAGCFHPDTLQAHASYAFNSYYQMKSRGSGTCDFGGTAHVVTQPPKYGSCHFPTGY